MPHKVCFISPEYWPLTGGTGSYVYYLSNELLKKPQKPVETHQKLLVCVEAAVGFASDGFGFTLPCGVDSAYEGFSEAGRNRKIRG